MIENTPSSAGHDRMSRANDGSHSKAAGRPDDTRKSAEPSSVRNAGTMASSTAKLSLGEELLQLLHPRQEEHILDAGCGTAELTARIAATGASVLGIDSSAASVERAKAQYPQLDLRVADLTAYRSELSFDAVFSHAVLHWITDAEAAARSIWHSLRPGGRFVAEFAAQGNTATILKALQQALLNHGYTWEGRNPWYHPTIGEYASLLERLGFRVLQAQHLDRPTPMRAEGGIRTWLSRFTPLFFQDVTVGDQTSILEATLSELEPLLVREGHWILEKSQLRIVAVKKTFPISS